MKVIIERNEENKTPPKDQSFVELLNQFNSSNASSSISNDHILKVRAIKQIQQDFSSVSR